MPSYAADAPAIALNMPEFAPYPNPTSAAQISILENADLRSS
jgi:hypothetical protein